MKTIALLLILVCITGCNLSTHFNTHKSLKHLGNEEMEKSKFYQNKITWKGDSTENSKLFFKILYLENFNGELGKLTPLSIDRIDSLEIINGHRKNLSRILNNYNALNHKHYKYNKNYDISSKELNTLDSLLNKRKDLLEKDFREKMDSIRIAKDSIIKEKAKDRLKGEVLTYFEEPVKTLEKWKNSESVKIIQNKSKNQAKISLKVTLSDTTIEYSVELSVFDKSFKKGVYYNQDVYDYLKNIFESIIHLHGKEGVICKVQGTADAISQGSKYPKGGMSYGTLNSHNISVTFIETDTITSIRSISISPRQTLTDVELALLRAKLASTIVKELLLKEPDYISLIDYGDSSNKKGMAYRTTGFTIVIPHNLFDEVPEELKESLTKEIGLDRPFFLRYYTNEKGELILDKRD